MTSQSNPDPLDQLRTDATRRIEQYGYTMTVVGTGECSVPGCTCGPEPYPYAYSLGMVEHGHPEVVVFGVPLSHVNTLARPVYEAAAAGSPLAVGRDQRHPLDGGPVISLVAVPDRWVQHDPGRIGSWFNVYGGPADQAPAFVQICWADRYGLLPWEPGCDADVAAHQPILADDPRRYPRPPRTVGRHQRRR